jgi:hypothetical protein
MSQTWLSSQLFLACCKGWNILLNRFNQTRVRGFLYAYYLVFGVGRLLAEPILRRRLYRPVFRPTRRWRCLVITRYAFSFRNQCLDQLASFRPTKRRILSTSPLAMRYSPQVMPWSINLVWNKGSRGRPSIPDSLKTGASRGKHLASVANTKFPLS